MLARPGINFKLVPQELLPERPISCCSMAAEAIGGCCQPFRLTGLYVPPPPTVRASGESIRAILAENSFNSWRGQPLNHLICGDLNPPGRREQFEEWIGESGLLELNDPRVPTYPSGNTLDYILLLPGESHFLSERRGPTREGVISKSTSSRQVCSPQQDQMLIIQCNWISRLPGN